MEMPLSAPIIATWMYSAPEGDESMHPQTGKDIGSQKVKNYYWRSVFCLFASAAAHMPESRKLLIVNEQPPAEIDGCQTAQLLQRFGVEIRMLKEITQPQDDFFIAWKTQFIVIDALEILMDEAVERQPVILLDSDCVFVRPLSTEILQRVDRDGILKYTLPQEDDRIENGLSNKDLAELAREYDPPLNQSLLRYAGGEMLFARGDLLPVMLKTARDAYRESIQRHLAGKKKFNEEAHLLSYVYEVFGGKDFSANDFIKRIWTDRGVYSTVTGEEGDLTIWHVPAEKKVGIPRLFRHLGRGGNYPATLEACERQFNIKPTLLSLLEMYVKKLLRTLRDLRK